MSRLSGPDPPVADGGKTQETASVYLDIYLVPFRQLKI